MRHLVVTFQLYALLSTTSKRNPTPPLLTSLPVVWPTQCFNCLVLFLPHQTLPIRWVSGKKEASYVCEKKKKRVSVQEPDINPYSASHGTLRISLHLSFLISKIEGGGHKNGPLRSPTAWNVIGRGPQPCCPKSITILVQPAKVWMLHSHFWERQVHCWEMWDSSNQWLWPKGPPSAFSKRSFFHIRQKLLLQNPFRSPPWE